uniref:Uncharacterized protein n=1 Tax=Eiseniibacteriota bacterium TaxID=2212470 RepID=A0A832MKR3_UNCEI
MEDTTDKSSALGNSTDDGAQAAADDDKDGTEQAETNTGASQDGNQAHEGAADGSERTEDSEQDDADSQEGSEKTEAQLLTPEEVAKLPPELKAQYRSMNQRFQERMREAKDAIEEAQRGPKKPGDQGNQPSPARAAVESALKRRGVDPKTLSAEHLASLELVAEVSMEAGQATARQVVTPLELREAKAQVDSYFEKYPDRAKHRVAMAKLDQQTDGKLDLDTLYYAVAGKQLADAAEGRKQKKLRDLSSDNSETGTGSTGKPAGEGDIFDEITAAGGHDNTVLR